MGDPPKFAFIQDNEFSGNFLSHEIENRLPGIHIMKDSSEITKDSVPEIILLNGFPDKHYPAISKSLGKDATVINFIPAGRHYRKIDYGIRHAECIYGHDDRGTTTIFLLGEEEKGEDEYSILGTIFPETPINKIIQDDLELMAADLILRPLIAGMVIGRMRADAESPYFSGLIVSAGISPLSENIGYIRDAIRYNHYSSSAFGEIEKSLKKTWNDLSNY